MGDESAGGNARIRRLAISVEGATEREFVSRVLKPHLEPLLLDVRAVDIRGNVSLDKVRGELPALLGSFDYVSTLYDFYGFKRRDGRSVTELEQAIHHLVEAHQQPRLIPYVQQYEFEALIFAVPELTVNCLQGRNSDLASMHDAIRRSGSPEHVNDGVETSPSHRLKKLFGGYDKKRHGPEIIQMAGLGAIRQTCKRFDTWVATLEGL